jgi:hypothetical protein
MDPMEPIRTLHRWTADRQGGKQANSYWRQPDKNKKGNWTWVHQKNKKSEELEETIGKPLQIFKVDNTIVVNFHETTVEILSNHRSFGTKRSSLLIRRSFLFWEFYHSARVGWQIVPATVLS